jgi:VRR-NUC domain
MKESDVQRQVLDYLTLKHIFHYRNNSGAFTRSDGHFYRFGTLGSPDIICVVNGQYVGIEVKAPKGKQSDHQKEFQKNLENAGGKYILAYSLDDVITTLTKSE